MITKPVSIRFCEVEEIRRLPGTWQFADLRRVLEILDMEDCDSIPEGDLEDMALMALQDLGIDEAASVVLTHFTEDRFTKGQVRNLCNEIREDRCWEEYADLAHQKTLYVCVDLLSAAFPFDYAEPDATRVTLTITGPGLEKTIAQHALGPDILLRGVSLCQEKQSILNRFFSDQIAGAPFPEADHVLWHIEQSAEGPNDLKVIFWGSSYWFEDIEERTEADCVLKWPES